MDSGHGYGFAGYYTPLFFLGPTTSSLRKPKGPAGVVGSCEIYPLLVFIQLQWQPLALAAARSILEVTTTSSLSDRDPPIVVDTGVGSQRRRRRALSRGV